MVKIGVHSVYIYGSYRKIKTGVGLPLFWTTLYIYVTFRCSLTVKTLKLSHLYS